MPSRTWGSDNARNVRDPNLGAAAKKLVLAVERSLQCRNCTANSVRKHPRHEWSFSRLESQATVALWAEARELGVGGEERELGVDFECAECKSIHLGVPFLDAWSMDDDVVEFIFEELPCWISAKTAKTATPRKARVVVDNALGSPVEVAAVDAAVARTAVEVDKEAAALEESKAAAAAAAAAASRKSKAPATPQGSR